MTSLNRGAKDNCLSIFKNAFGSAEMEWSHSQKDIGGILQFIFKDYELLEKKIARIYI